MAQDPKRVLYRPVEPVATAFPQSSTMQLSSPVAAASTARTPYVNQTPVTDGVDDVLAKTGANKYLASPVQDYTTPDIPISKGTGGSGAGGLGSAIGAGLGLGIGALLAIPTGGLSLLAGAGLGSAIGGSAGAIGGGIIDWIMGEDAADKQEAETERINAEMMRQRGEEMAREDRRFNAQMALRTRQQRESEMLNKWKMKNEESDRRLQRGFLFATTLTGMMGANDAYRTNLINIRRGTA